jgi:hypothetical protein
MDVPELGLESHDGAGTTKLVAADVTHDPGATTSGLMRPSRVRPRDENPVVQVGSTSPWSAAPTAITFFPVAGEITVSDSGPEFPAAKTTTASR